ncbi:cobalamin biosynthesis protein [Mesorhizobium sp. SB112]|uniref:cobalamin biosynthesis protein n=1 Tax=Mesorhizobium sp. SB112 TaxID=3151853 RepID=UPI003266BF6B
MIVAGIGCRKGATEHEVLAATHAALSTHCLASTRLSALATIQLKAQETGIIAAARTLAKPLLIANDDAIAAVDAKLLTRSEASLSAAGTPSVSEASALAIAGKNSRLLGPRHVEGDVTCAIAVSGDEP